MSNETGNEQPKKPKLNEEPLENGESPELQINPLFNEVVFENVLKLLKGNSNALVLRNFRLVCKFWDREIVKMIRRDTFINLKYILLPYPEGMGWIASKKENSSQYKVSYPEVRPFENIKLTVNYHENFPFKKKTLVNWFKAMGSTVKEIRFESSLNEKDTRCYTILENILKEWCPNLQRLIFDGVKVFDSLIISSRFTNTTKQIICTGLKEVKISVNANQKYKWSTRKMPTILTKSRDFMAFIHQIGLPDYSTEFPEFQNHSGTIIAIPSELFQNSDRFPDISQFISEDFFPNGMDGGILGQLISCTSVESFCLVGSTTSWNIRHMIALFHYRKNCWRSSLKHFELDLVHGNSISKDLVVFGKLGCPLVTLKINQDVDRQYAEVSIENITRFIACFAITLQHLEYSGQFKSEYGRVTKFLLPELPNLKTFIYKNSSDDELCPINVMRNLPSLETLHLTVYPRKRTIETFFQIETGNLTNELLTDLKITGKISGRKACKLVNWFPNLRRMELNLHDKDDGTRGFLEELENLQLEHLNLTWSRTKDQDRSLWRNNSLICDMGKLKLLKTLEMKYDHPTDPFLVPLSGFSEGFGILPDLRILKLTNFGVSDGDFPEIKNCLEYIPVKQFVNLSLHGLSLTMYH